MFSLSEILCLPVSDVKQKTEVEDVSAAGEILNEGISELLDGKTVEQYNQNYIDTESESGIVHRAVIVEMLVILDPDRKATHMSLLQKQTERPTLKECEKVHQMLLGSVLNAPEMAMEWKSKCAEWFPRSSYFDGPCMTQPSEKLESAPDSAK